MPDITIITLDPDSQILAGEKLLFRDNPMISLPITGDEASLFQPNFVEAAAAGRVITATKNPGNGSPSDSVKGSPKPELASLFFRKCHISSRATIVCSAVISGSGSASASARLQRITETSLTPRSRPIALKLILPIAYIRIASAFIAGGLPRGGADVKLLLHPRQR